MPIFTKSKQTTKTLESSDSGSHNLRDRLTKSRNVFRRGLVTLFGGARDFNSAVLDDLEDLLISADLGVGCSTKIVDHLRIVAKQKTIDDAKELIDEIRKQMMDILQPCSDVSSMDGRPYVILVVGVNGVGKTTTIAKMANWFIQKNFSVMLAAADTFRAAAVEQITLWGERLNIPVISQGQDADAAAVAHDALVSATARSIDILIIDTAGRQHTQNELMDQLKKIKRVLNKIEPEAPHEIMQILDAATGQNSLAQLEHFHKAVQVNSLCLTKLDGTAKGGILLALADRFALPVRFIGVGEGPDDLRPFNKDQFIDALLPDPESF